MSAVAMIEFLQARIAEDEGTALYAKTRAAVEPEDWGGWWLGHYQHYSRYTPDRVISDCESKRGIIRLAAEQPQTFAEVLRWLAEAYDDHDDYLEEWRP